MGLFSNFCFDCPCERVFNLEIIPGFDGRLDVCQLVAINVRAPSSNC